MLGRMTITAARLLATLSVAACYDAVIPNATAATQDEDGAGDFVSVAAGLEHTCAVHSGGDLSCWGSNEFQQLGIDATLGTCRRDDRDVPCSKVPLATAPGLSFAKVVAGFEHTCGLTTAFEVYCWGDNLQGQVGVPEIRRTAAPVHVAPGTLFVDLAAGGRHTCALRGDGVLLCWGANESGQLGLASTGIGVATPSTVRTAQRFASVAAGARRTCARTADGTTFCWGQTWVSSNSDDDATRNQTQPAAVPAAPALRALTVGGSSCGLDAQSRALCWEGNARGTIGDGSTSGSVSPVFVATDRLFIAISGGAQQTCAIADTGYVYCWGANEFGEMGVSPGLLPLRCRSGVPCSTRPIRIAGWRRFKDLSAGLGNHVCAVTIAGNVYCWGAGGLGQRGDGRATTRQFSPVKALTR